MKKAKDHRPGWLFIDRYMPDATAAEQEAAYENLKALVAVVWEIDQRISREKAATVDSPIRMNRIHAVDSDSAI